MPAKRGDSVGKKLRSMNVQYVLAMALYLCSYSVITVFASSYLLEKGCSNSVIGISFSVVGALTLLTQPFIASAADENREQKVRWMILVFLAVSVAATGGLLSLPEGSPFLLPLFMLVEYCLLTIQPLLNSLAFIFESYGIYIHFGIARGIGSAGYGFSSILVGRMIEGTSTRNVPFVYLIANLLLVLVLFNYGRELGIQKMEQIARKKAPLSTWSFYKKYKRFMLFILASIFIYFAHVTIFNFFIHIVMPVGGSENDVGKAVFLSTFLEAFATAAMPWLVKKISCSVILKFAAVMFIVRNIIMCTAHSMTWIYIGSAFQLVSYALFYPGSIFYANFMIPETDRVKSQSLVTINYTASSIFASLIGGIVIDLWGIGQALMIGTALSCVGAIIVFASVKENKNIQ